MTDPKSLKQKSNQPRSRKPIQLNTPAPFFSTTPKAVAKEYYQQALQAYQINQAQEAYRLSQLCINTTKDTALKISAMSLSAAALMMMQQREQALLLWQEIDKSLPNDVNNLSNIGMVLIQFQRFIDAIGYLERAIKIQPHFHSYLNLGFAYHQCGDISRAQEIYLHAFQCDPKSIQTGLNLAAVLRDGGQPIEAMQIYEQILKLDPKHLSTSSVMIFLQNFIYPTNLERQMQLLINYGKQFNQVVPTHQPKLLRHRPLRVGFVSADLHQHPVGYFLESVLEQLRTNAELHPKIKLIAYHNHDLTDEYTQRLHQKFDIWHQVQEWDDNRLIEQIQRDQIDILIDLSGHTTGTRLPVFARKPSPLQVSWLGYFGSTGLANIDYVLADPICVPAAEEHLFIEKIWRLPSLRYCFSAPENAPDVSIAPCSSRHQVTFGCYQSIQKINSGVLSCWANILTAAPQARIRIQSKNLEKLGIRNRFLEQLQEAQIDVQRIDLIAPMARSQYLSSYAEVDMMLDTFPFTGGTTTAEALWMGVPTLTLTSAGMLGRQGEALMRNAGLSDWVVSSEEEYLNKAITWANANVQQQQKLATLRIKIREQVKDSPIFNAKKFALDFVEAMYGMWNEKCSQQS